MKENSEIIILFLIKHNSGQGTQLIYYGDALSWYGYFKGRNLIVVDSQDRPTEETVYLKNNFRLVYAAEDPGTELEKFLVFENFQKTP